MTNRNIDALVAEKVMGCKVISGIRAQAICGCCPPAPDEVLALPHAIPGWANIRPYSTTGDGMLLVIEAMRGKYGLKGHNGFTLMRQGDQKWYCEFPAPTWEDAMADTAPMAVSLAALKALGVEVSDGA